MIWTIISVVFLPVVVIPFSSPIQRRNSIRYHNKYLSCPLERCSSSSSCINLSSRTFRLYYNTGSTTSSNDDTDVVAIANKVTTSVAAATPIYFGLLPPYDRVLDVDLDRQAIVFEVLLCLRIMHIALTCINLVHCIR